MRRLAGLLLAAAVVTGCSDGAAPSTDAAAESPAEIPTGDPGVAPAAPESLTLLDPGSAPLVELRYRAPAGTVDRVVQRQIISLTQRIGAETQTIPTPVTEIVTRYELGEAADGRRRLAYAFEELRVLPTAGVPDETIEQTRGLLDQLASGTGRMTISDRGVVGSNEVDIEPTGNPVLDQLVTGIEDQAAQLALPFPDEPVGVGARWAIDVDLELAGLPMRSSSVIQITSIDGDLIGADLEIAVVFVPGPTTIAGVDATLVEGALRGTGTVRWNLATQLVPRVDQTASGVTILQIGDTVLEQEQEQHTTVIDPD